MKTFMKKALLELLKKEGIPVVENMDYILEYVTSAQIGIISYWMVEKDMDLPISEIGAMIRGITNHGPVGYLKKQKAITTDNG